MLKRFVTPALLRSVLIYYADTGDLVWRKRDDTTLPARSVNSWNTRFAGKFALNSLNKLGYRIGAVFGHSFAAHRVAWAIVHGTFPEAIDHINGDRGDNRLGNLRAVSLSDNQRNRQRPTNNTSGHMGVYRRHDGKAWCAQVKRGAKTEYLGSFGSMAEAIAARDYAKDGHGFHENHGRDTA